MSKIKEQDRKKDEEGQVAIKRLSKPIKGRILLAQIFTFFSALLSFVPYLALVWLGDIFLSAQTTGEQIDAVQVHKVVNLLVMAFLSKLFFHALSLIITHFADMKLRFIIRQRIVERLSHVPLAWFSQTDSGKIRNAVQDDTKTVHTVVAHAPVDTLNGVLAPLVLLVFMFVINWRLALISIVTIPLYFLLQGISMKDMGPKTAEMNRHLGEVSSTMIELVAGIKVLLFRHLHRECQHDAAGKLGVPLVLHSFHSVPERCPVCKSGRRMGRQHDLSMNKFFLLVVEFCFLVVLAEQPFAALVSGPGNSGLPLAALDDGNFEMRTRNRHHPQTKRPPSKIALDERSGIVFGFARRLGTECCALRFQAGAAKG